MNTISSYSNGFNPLSNLQELQQNATEKIKDIDTDSSGGISLEEFSASAADKNPAMSEERMSKLFERMDADQSGEISEEELSNMLQQMKEKMQSKAGGGGFQVDTTDQLLELLSSDDEDQTDAKNAFFEQLNQRYPSIDKFA